MTLTKLSSILIFSQCPPSGWPQTPRGTGTTCVRMVHDQLYVDGMAKSEAVTDGNRKINKSLSMFRPAGYILWLRKMRNGWQVWKRRSFLTFLPCFEYRTTGQTAAHYQQVTCCAKNSHPLVCFCATLDYHAQCAPPNLSLQITY